MQEVEQLEARAQAFIEENRELVEDPETSSDVLGRIFVHGEPIAREFDVLMNELADAAVEARGPLGAALEDSFVPPLELKEREDAFWVPQARYEQISAAFEPFKEFMEKVLACCDSKLEEEDQGEIPPERSNRGVVGEVSTGVHGKLSDDELSSYWHDVPGDEVESLEEPVQRESPGRTYKPSLWRRLFG